MSGHYVVRNVVFASGERFPMLLNACTGLPLFDATAYILSEVRGRNRASATIEAVLRSLKVFQLFCDHYRISLAERMLSGQLLEMGELDALARLCRLPMSEIDLQIGPRLIGCRCAPFRDQQVRGKYVAPEVASDAAGVRIRYIRDFIDWLADRRILSVAANHPTCEGLRAAKATVVSRLTARMPSGKGRNKARSRKALDDIAQDRLWQIIHVDSPENPWEGRHPRVRNDLIMRWFVGLGIRRGELLGVRVTDINFRKGEVFIARRADDPSDPRPYQPNTKTYDRTLHISDDLARRTHQYIVEERRRYLAARKHPFLFIANGGAPLSLRGLNAIFIGLRKRHPDLPNIFPHILRHTNNYNFSRLADEQGMSPEVERKTRAQMMGWSETSGTAETYTRRETERRARAASLQLQNKMVNPHNELD